MTTPNWYWDLNLSLDVLKAILSDDAHPRFAEIAGRLLARSRDHQQVFSLITPLAFCHRFYAIQAQIKRDEWTKEQAAFWQATYERYRREFRRSGVRIRRRTVTRELDAFPADLVSRIRECRKYARLSQAELANRLQYSQQFISGIEQGREKITVDYLRSLAKATGHTLHVIFQKAEACRLQEKKLAEEYANLKAWIDSRRRDALEVAKEHQLDKGLMEVVAYRPDAVVNARQDEWHEAEDQVLQHRQNVMLDKMERTQIHTFGWPIGLVLDREDYRPRVYNDGVRASILTEDRSHYDYWALRKDLVFYLLKTLFEDLRAEKKVFLDTRIIRTAETILRIGRLYEVLGVSGSETVVIKIHYRGLRGRALSVADPARRMVEQRISVEDEVETSIRERLEHLTPKVVDLVHAAVSELTILFDGFIPDKERVVKPLVEQFMKGRI